MINQSKKFIKCRTLAEGNRIYGERAVPHIDAILVCAGVERSTQKGWEFRDGMFFRVNDRERIAFGHWEDNNVERGLMAFDEYIINESDLIPQGERKVESLEIDEVFNELSSDIEIVKTYSTTQSFTVSKQESFNASFGLELEQHWETKATAGGEAYGGSVEASTGGSIKVSTNFGWENSVSKEKMSGESESVEIPVPIPAGRSVKVYREKVAQDMMIKTQLLGVLRPSFFCVDYKKSFGPRLRGNKDARGWRSSKSRIIFQMRDVNDIYNFVTGNNSRYPNQKDNLMKKHKAVREAMDFFSDKDNRSFVQNDERIMKDASAKRIYLKEQTADDED